MVGDGTGAGGRGWSQPDCEGPQKPCEGLWPWGAIGIQDKQDMIRFVSQRDHSGNCEGLLEWREAGSREAVWEAFAKILVRNDDSVKEWVPFLFLLGSQRWSKIKELYLKLF